MKQPGIFYFCPSTERPFGGIKQHAKDPGLLRLARQGLAAGKRFSMEREEQAVVRAWSKLLAS